MKRIICLILFVFVIYSLGQAQGTIRITSPKGNEKWLLGSSQQITWEAANISNTFRIILWKDNVKVGLIARDLSSDTRSHTWTVGTHTSGTAPIAAGYTIKINERNTEVQDWCDQSFEIIGLKPISGKIRTKPVSLRLPPLRVTVPGRNERWKMGASYEIKWIHSTNVTGNVKIELWDFITNKKGMDIVNNWPINKNYSWPIPAEGLAERDCRILVKTADNSVQDFSEKFTVYLPPPRITIISPTRSTQWKRGMSHEIKWTREGQLHALVRIELWTLHAMAGGIGSVPSKVKTIWAQTDNDGSYFWGIPSTERTDREYFIKVITLDNSYEAFSGVFDIIE